MTIGVNGDDYSWGSIIIRLDSEIFDAFTKVAYSDKITRTLGYGAGKHHAPTKRSRGKYEVDPGKLTGYLYEVKRLRASLARRSTNGKSYGQVEFPCVIQYEEGGVVHQVDLVRNKWAEDGSSHDEGPDLLVVEFSFQPMRILRDGLTLYDSTKGPR